MTEPDEPPLWVAALHHVLDNADLRWPETRARAAEQAIELIGTYSPTRQIRDLYLQAISDRCRIDIEVLQRIVAERCGPTLDESIDAIFDDR